MTGPLPPVAILAGGLATRLGTLTVTAPKSMLPVAGQPFIAHQLALLRRRGISEVVLCIGHLGDQIRAFVGDGSRFGLRVRYSEDGERLLGTGGAVRKATALLGPTFFVTYGDSYLDTAYEPLVARLDSLSAAAVMAVFRNEGRWERSNVEYADGWVTCYDKMRPTPGMLHVDYGLTLMRADVLESSSGEPLDLAEVLAALSRGGRLAGYEVSERFYEVGSVSGLADAERYLRERRME